MFLVIEDGGHMNKFQHSGKRVCITPHFQGLSAGGPKSFVSKLTNGLKTRGIDVTHDLLDTPYHAVLVVANTRQFPSLIRMKGKTRIVHRLDGLFWRHRAQKMPLKWKYRTIYMNLGMAFIRRFIPDYVIYQSKFVKDWWEKDYGKLTVPDTVIYNGVDTRLFSPSGDAYRSGADYLLINVEGYRPFQSVSLDFPVSVARGLKEKGLNIELKMFGDLHSDFKASISKDSFIGTGLVQNQDLPYYYRGAHLFISAEINHGSPNAVSEALACGVPVIGFSTGALPELVGNTTNGCVPYGANYWKLESPGNINGLIDAAFMSLKNHDEYSKKARQRAVELFDLEKMIDYYVEVLFS